MPPTFPANSAVIDAFTRANEGPPMTGWADIVAGVKVLSNQAAGNAVGTNWSYLVALSRKIPDVDLFVTVATKPGTADSCSIHHFDPDLNGYAVSLAVSAGTDGITLNRMDAGVATVLGATISQEVAAGEKLGLRRIYDAIEAYLFTGGAWTLLGTRTDATYADERINLVALFIGNTTCRLDDFSGGAIPASAELTGTALAGITEDDIVAGGKTIVMTLYGDRVMPS